MRLAALLLPPLLALTAPAAAQAPAAAALPPPEADARRHVFHLDWGPVSLAEIRISLSETPEVRVMRAEAESLGVAALFADFAVRQTAVIEAGGPRRFVTDARWGDETRRRAVLWPGPDAAPQVDHMGAPPEGPRTPIPPGALSGAVDPATASLALLDRFAAGEGCGGTFRLFDGVRRLDMTVIDEGAERLEADRPWTYAGPARRCRIRFERIGGFEADEPRETAERDYDRLLWIADLPEGPAPVRLRVAWPLGAAVGRIDLRESARPLEN
jgi:hypothetical protein